MSNRLRLPRPADQRTLRPLGRGSQIMRDQRTDTARTIGRARSSSALVVPQGRLTLSTGVAVTASDQSGVTSIYYTPVSGELAPVFNGVYWRNVDVGGELTLALDSDSGHTGYHQSGKGFDLFLADVAGTIYFGTGPAWSSDTARSAAISLSNGIYVNTSSMTLRHGSSSGNTVTVPAGQGTYLGSFYATANGQASDTVLLRYLFNAYNQAPRAVRRSEATATWTYSTASYQQARNQAANQVSIFAGLDSYYGDIQCAALCSNSDLDARSVLIGIGIDSSTVDSSMGPGYIQTGGIAAAFAGHTVYRGNCGGLGRHDIRWLEYGNATGGDTQTWYGNTALTGLSGTVWA